MYYTITKYILLKLGISPNLKGYTYLQMCISEYCITSHKTTFSNLFRKISIKYNLENSSIEKTIRYAIITSWHKRDKNLSKEIFGNTLQSEQDIPSNSLYIAAVAEYIKIKNDNCF